MDDIRILQLGEEDWGLSYQIPGGIRIYHEKPELRRAGDAFELVFWDREPREQELENLRNVTKAYTLYLVEGVQLGEKAKELLHARWERRLPESRYRNFFCRRREIIILHLMERSLSQARLAYRRILRERLSGMATTACL